MRITSNLRSLMCDDYIIRNKKVVVVFFLIVFIIFSNFSSGRKFHEFRPRSKWLYSSDVKYSAQFTAFYDCAYPELSKYRNDPENLWKNFEKSTKPCDNSEILKRIDLRPVNNADEVKWVAYPKQAENLTMVTLGIGKDTSGEELLRKSYKNIDFFGADPSSVPNKELYEKLGVYFPFAVSEASGMKTSDVLRETYSNEVTLHIGAGHFFDEIMRRKKIDILWMDTEGNEYTFLDLLHSDAEFDQRGVSICQMNIEMHTKRINGWNGEKQKFHDFIFRLLDDGKYIMMKTFTFEPLDFLRIVILNVENSECRRLYL